VPVLKGILQAEGAVVDVQVGWSAGQVRQLRHAQRPFWTVQDSSI
jgi:hypothetical protein